MRVRRSLGVVIASVTFAAVALPASASTTLAPAPVTTAPSAVAVAPPEKVQEVVATAVGTASDAIADSVDAAELQRAIGRTVDTVGNQVGEINIFPLVDSVVATVDGVRDDVGDVDVSPTVDRVGTLVDQAENAVDQVREEADKVDLKPLAAEISDAVEGALGEVDDQDPRPLVDQVESSIEQIRGEVDGIRPKPITDAAELAAEVQDRVDNIDTPDPQPLADMVDQIVAELIAAIGECTGDYYSACQEAKREVLQLGQDLLAALDKCSNDQSSTCQVLAKTINDAANDCANNSYGTCQTLLRNAGGAAGLLIGVALSVSGPALACAASLSGGAENGGSDTLSSVCAQAQAVAGPDEGSFNYTTPTMEDFGDIRQPWRPATATTDYAAEIHYLLGGNVNSLGAANTIGCQPRGDEVERSNSRDFRSETTGYTAFYSITPYRVRRTIYNAESREAMYEVAVCGYAGAKTRNGYRLDLNNLNISLYGTSVAVGPSGGEQHNKVLQNVSFEQSNTTDAARGEISFTAGGGALGVSGAVATSSGGRNTGSFGVPGPDGAKGPYRTSPENASDSFWQDTSAFYLPRQLKGTADFIGTVQVARYSLGMESQPAYRLYFGQSLKYHCGAGISIPIAQVSGCKNLNAPVQSP